MIHIIGLCAPVPWRLLGGLAGVHVLSSIPYAFGFWASRSGPVDVVLKA